MCGFGDSEICGACRRRRRRRRRRVGENRTARTRRSGKRGKREDGEEGAESTAPACGSPTNKRRFGWIVCVGVVFFYRGELLSAERGKLGAAVCLSVCRYSACFYGFQKDSQGVERSAKGSAYIMQCR